MADEKNVQSTQTAAPRAKREGGRGGNRSDQSDRRGRGRGRGKREERAPREFEQKILDLARVTRVTAGGKRMSFRCALVIGDKKGKVGMGIAKGGDVQIAIEKAYKQAKKHVLKVPLVEGTIPHTVRLKFGSAIVLLKPAPKGTGLKAGGAVRMVLEFAGVPNAVSKILNSSNKINIAKATLEALEQLRYVEPEVVADVQAIKEPQTVVETT
ncbi:30S ribosomal protein S5 [Candidatus Uhrbacteria bacterium]|nr:30S ribosomal protein S5 [Candidatus Uhrbacteria bacterium]